MASRRIKGITIEIGGDTTKLSAALKGVDKSLSQTEAELRDVNKLLKFDPKNTTLLKQKQDLLKSAISDTDEKLKKEKEALSQLKKADQSPEVEKQMRALERQIVDDEGKMKNFNKELKETEKASSGVENAKQKFKAFGKGLGKVGKVVGGIAAGGAAVIGGTAVAVEKAGKVIGKFANESAEAGDEVDKMSQKLGLSRKGYQEWDYVLAQAGVDINSLQTGMKTMTNQIGAAKNGTAASVEVFDKLGISMQELQGMSREDAFKNIVTSLQGMEDSTERAALANKLFGKSGQNLTPLFNQSAEGTQKLIEEANKLGAVMGDDAVDAAVAYEDQLAGLQHTFETVKNGISATMLPAITDLMGGFQGLLAGDENGAAQIEKGFTNLFDSLGTIFEKIGGIVEPIISAFSKVFPKIIQGFTSAIISHLPALINMAIGIIQAILDAVGNSSAQFINAIVQVVMMLVDLIVKNLPLLITVGIQAIVALATGIAEALPDLIPVIIQLVIEICNLIIENLPLIIDAGIAIIIGLMDGIMEALPKLLKYIPTLIVKVLQALGRIIPKLVKLAGNMFKSLTKPFEKIGEFFGKIREKIVGKFKSIGSKVGEAIGGAFKSAINAVLSTVENALNKIPNAINKVREVINKLTGANISELPQIELPRLSSGGVTVGTTAALIGDNRSRNEAVLPLDDPRAVKMLADAMGGNAGAGATVNQTFNIGQMNSYREAYLIRRATEQGLKKMMRAKV